MTMGGGKPMVRGSEGAVSCLRRRLGARRARRGMPSPVKSRTATYLITVLAAATLSACASLNGARTETLDNRRVEYVLTRNDTAPVIFESGLGGTLNWWAKVYPEVAKDTTAFTYNRPGYGDSEPASTPRDGMHIVDELRSLLRGKGLKPPYVLVGHSLGGLYMQLFARCYPDEVKALILVDSTHPEQLTGNGSPENWPTWVRWGFDLLTTATGKAELYGIPATGKRVLSLPMVTGKPAIILSAAEPLRETSALADDANAKRRDLARLYPGARQIWVDCGHGIPLEKPDSVIAAIREVLAAKTPAPAQGLNPGTRWQILAAEPL